METNEGAVLGWQPIETAPKNRAVLVWDGDCMHIASRQDLSPSYPWCEECVCDDPMTVEPTHWMPLPAPPSPALVTLMTEFDQ